jgi:hypothetical protein
MLKRKTAISSEMKCKLAAKDAWQVEGRWHYAHRNSENDCLTVLEFETKEAGGTFTGWLPLKINARTLRVEKTADDDGALIRWSDKTSDTVLYKNIKPVYWKTLSGKGHTLREIDSIRKSLAGGKATAKK